LGRIAQLVEQLTLNQRVQGSSPCAPTNLFKDLAMTGTLHSDNRVKHSDKSAFFVLRGPIYCQSYGARQSMTNGITR
jgi:hypothetical protein